MFSLLLNLGHGPLQFGNVFCAHIDASLQEVAIHLHLVEGTVEVLFLEHEELEIFVPAEILTIVHWVCQSRQEISQLHLRQVE